MTRITARLTETFRLSAHVRHGHLDSAWREPKHVDDLEGYRERHSTVCSSCEGVVGGNSLVDSDEDRARTNGGDDHEDVC